MSKSKSFISILIPSATVFLSSGCIMVLELVAGRLIARHLGSSLYTWTSVIGVVLAGITIGNYLGGRIADRFSARKALAVLFAICSVTCVGIVVFNNIVGEWIWLWRLNWPLRVFSHVALVFLVPSTLLGTISPVVAKMALDRGLPTGRTVGDIYAWGAAGSIAGTFLTGFYLIAAMGTIAIIWSVGAVLLLMAILYWTRLWLLYLWAAIFTALVTMGMAPANWAKDLGASIALREKPKPNIIYEDESQYCYIAVQRISDEVDKRTFMQDKLVHSQIIMEDINNLQYFYTHIYAAITRALSQNKDSISVMVIGGGGYVYPRYIEKNWPGSRIDVAEIDPGVTKAAMQAFGLQRDTTINTFTMDARNYVDELLEKQRNGDEIPRYDFIYEDAINDYSVPSQLVTKEFNDKIAQILKENGVYMVNLLDTYDDGQFLGSMVNTLQQTFPNVYVLSETWPSSTRNTFVTVAAKHEINIEKLIGRYTQDLDIRYYDNSDINTVIQKSGGIILTDDYVPVENLLAPVVRKSGTGLLAQKYLEQAKDLRKNGRWDKSISRYKDVIATDPTLSIAAYNDMGLILVAQNRLEEAIDVFKNAIEYNEKAELKQSMSNINYNIGTTLKKVGKDDEASEYLRRAIQEYREDLRERPDSIDSVSRLGNALAENGQFSEATKYFQIAVDMNPYHMINHTILVQVLLIQERYDEAIAALKKAATSMSHIGDTEATAKLKQYLEFVEFKKANAVK